MAGVSFGVRASVLGALVALQEETSSCHDELCQYDTMPAILTALTAGVIFMAVDDLFLSRVTRSPDADTATAVARRFSRPWFAPSLAPARGGATMALVGTF